MSSRYIARKYGNKGGGDESRPSSRASVGRNDSASRPPSRGASMANDSLSVSRPSSRGSYVLSSRGASPIPSYYESYNGTGSGRSTPELDFPASSLLSGNNSRATTPQNFPSRRQRERSIPPPALLPAKIEFVRELPLSGRPPPAPARVVASDFYRGKTKSIYEREPLFKISCKPFHNAIMVPSIFITLAPWIP